MTRAAREKIASRQMRDARRNTTGFARLAKSARRAGKIADFTHHADNEKAERRRIAAARRVFK